MTIWICLLWICQVIIPTVPNTLTYLSLRFSGWKWPLPWGSWQRQDCPGRPAAGKPGWSVKSRKDGRGGKNSDLRATESLSESLPIYHTITRLRTGGPLWLVCCPQLAINLSTIPFFLSSIHYSSNILWNVECVPRVCLGEKRELHP